MEMQYILFYNPAFVTLFFFCLTFLSSLAAIYCTNSPNISYAMSRLLNFKLPLLNIVSQNVSPVICRIHSVQLGSSHRSLLELRQPEARFGINHKQPVP